MISEKAWTRVKGVYTNKAPLLRTYTGSTIQPLGQVRRGLDHNNHHHSLNALESGSGPNLLGRDRLLVLKLDGAAVHQVDRDNFLVNVQAVFSEGLSTIKGITAKFYVDDTVKTSYYKPRHVPLSLQAKVEARLDRLQEGVIRPVDYSEWAAPIVPVLIPTGAVRMCGHYMCPIPNTNDLFTKLSGGQLYTKLDINHAYQQSTRRSVTQTHHHHPRVYSRGSRNSCFETSQ